MLFYEVKAYKIKQLTLLKVHWYMWDTLHKEILNDSWKQTYSSNKNIAKLAVKLKVKSMPLEPK